MLHIRKVKDALKKGIDDSVDRSALSKMELFQANQDVFEFAGRAKASQIEKEIELLVLPDVADVMCRNNDLHEQDALTVLLEMRKAFMIMNIGVGDSNLYIDKGINVNMKRVLMLECRVRNAIESGDNKDFVFEAQYPRTGRFNHLDKKYDLPKCSADDMKRIDAALELTKDWFSGFSFSREITDLMLEGVLSAKERPHRLPRSVPLDDDGLLTKQYSPVYIVSTRETKKKGDYIRSLSHQTFTLNEDVLKSVCTKTKQGKLTPNKALKMAKPKQAQYVDVKKGKFVKQNRESQEYKDYMKGHHNFKQAKSLFYASENHWSAMVEACKLYNAGVKDITFAYKADTRGRVYALGGYLSPQATDIAKGLLTPTAPKLGPTFIGSVYDVDKTYSGLTGAELQTLYKYNAIMDEIDGIFLSDMPWWTGTKPCTKTSPVSYLLKIYNTQEWIDLIDNMKESLSHELQTHLIASETIVEVDQTSSVFIFVGSFLQSKHNEVSNVYANKDDKRKDTYLNFANELREALPNIDSDSPLFDRSTTKVSMPAAYGSKPQQVYFSWIDKAGVEGTTELRDTFLSVLPNNAPTVYTEHMAKLGSLIAERYLKTKVIPFFSLMGFHGLDILKVSQRAKVLNHCNDISTIVYGNVSRSRTASSLPPNFLHHVDATVIARTKEICVSRGIPVSPIHDALITDVRYIVAAHNAMTEAMDEVLALRPLQKFEEAMAKYLNVPVSDIAFPDIQLTPETPIKEGVWLLP